MVAGAQREVAVNDVDQLQRRASDQAPAAGPLFSVNPRLPPRQTDTARLDAQTGRRPPRHPAQPVRQVAQVREAGTEADGVHHVLRAAVQPHHLVRRQAAVGRHGFQVRPQGVTARDDVRAARFGVLAGGVQSAQPVGHGGEADDAQVVEDGDGAVGLDDVEEPGRVAAADGGRQADGAGLVGGRRQGRLVAERLHAEHDSSPASGGSDAPGAFSPDALTGAFTRPARLRGEPPPLPPVFR